MEGLKNIVSFFGNLIEFVKNILSYLNPLSEKFLLKPVLDFLVDILDYLNPFSDNFILKPVLDNLADFFSFLFSFLGEILSYINPFSENFFVYKLIELLSDLLEFLFIPSDDRVDAIINTVSSKFAFVDSIKEAVNSLQNIITNLGNSPKLETSNISSKYFSGKLTVIDLSWYAPFKPYGDLAITGFCYLFFLWRLFVHLPNIIHGTGGDIGSIREREL